MAAIFGQVEEAMSTAVHRGVVVDLDREAAECRGDLRHLIHENGKDLASECHHLMRRAADRDRGRFRLPVGVLLVDALLPLHVPSRPTMIDSD